MIGFSAHFNNANANTLAPGSWSKLTPGTTIFNDSGYYAAGRFLPTGGSAIRCRLSAFLTAPEAPHIHGTFEAAVFLNGNLYRHIGQRSTCGPMGCVPCIIPLNGTTDYVELFVRQFDGPMQLLSDPAQTWIVGEVIP